MTLPESGRVEVSKLAAVFADTTNSYKFYWLLAILDSLRENEQSRLAMSELSLRMLAGVWYPLDYFKLSFGKQDGFKPIAHFISAYMTVDNNPKAPNLFLQLTTKLTASELATLHRKLQVLLNWVPYRFIRPFFASETRGLPDQKVNALVQDLANQTTYAPYRFAGEYIELHDSWIGYFQEHQAILRGFTSWHLLRFLQKHNPNVIGLSEKLERPGFRNFTLATKYWKTYLTEKKHVKCIYSGAPITTTALSLDHFLPWSFVAHDHLWNLIPTSKEVNSSKSDWLPSVELYFDGYAQLQYEAFHFHAAKGHDKLLEDYHLLFAQDLSTIRQHNFEWFREGLRKQVIPQLQTAQNLGFSYPYVHRSD